MKTKELVLQVNPKEYGLEESKALEMVNGLSTTIAEREVLKNAYVDVIDLDITEDNLPTFKELRLKIRDNRTKGLDKWKVSQKAYFLAGGNFVQAIYNKEILVNQEMEAKLMEAEKHFENLEKERIAEIQDQRIRLISPYLESVENLYLSDMEEDVWEAYLKTKKDSYIALVEAELKIEKERVEAQRLEKERIEKQRIENDLLKKEADLREKEILKERKEREEKQKIEDDIKEAVLRKEREEKYKLEAQLKAKQLEESKEIARKDAEVLKAKKDAEKLAKEPVKKQLNLWVDGFNIDLPNSELLNNEKALLIKSKFDAFKKWAKSEIEIL
jgi:colicin import membrane protein